LSILSLSCVVLEAQSKYQLLVNMVSASLVVLALAGTALASWTGGGGGWSSPVFTWSGATSWQVYTPASATVIATYTATTYPVTYSSWYHSSSAIWTSTPVTVTSTYVWSSASVVPTSSPVWTYIPSSVAPSPATTWAVWTQPYTTPTPIPVPETTPVPVTPVPETTPVPVTPVPETTPVPVTTPAPVVITPTTSVSIASFTPTPTVATFTGAAIANKPAAALFGGMVALIALA
jgi:hypothetical protein